MPRKGKSKPVRFESRTARLAVDPAHVKFVRVMIPQTGAVKQYAESEQASRSGKWHISLKHRPNLQKGWVALKHLYTLDGPRKNLPYETEAAAEKEVVLHMMTLEGFDRDGRALLRAQRAAAFHHGDQQHHGFCMGAGQRRVGAAWQHHRHRFDTQQTSVDFDPNECHHRRQRWCIPSLLCFFVLVLSVTSTADITCSDADRRRRASAPRPPFPPSDGGPDQTSTPTAFSGRGHG